MVPAPGTARGRAANAAEDSLVDASWSAVLHGRLVSQLGPEEVCRRSLYTTQPAVAQLRIAHRSLRAGVLLACLLVGVFALGEHDGVGAELAASPFAPFLFHPRCPLPRNLTVALRCLPTGAQL